MMPAVRAFAAGITRRRIPTGRFAQRLNARSSYRRRPLADLPENLFFPDTVSLHELPTEGGDEGLVWLFGIHVICRKGRKARWQLAFTQTLANQKVPFFSSKSLWLCWRICSAME